MFINVNDEKTTAKKNVQSIVIRACILLVSIFGLAIQPSLTQAAATTFNKSAGVPYKPIASSFQKPTKQSYKPSTGLKKPFTNNATVVRQKNTALKPVPIKSTLPKRQFVPKASPGGNPLPAVGGSGSKPPSTTKKAAGSGPPLPPKKLTPIFNKASGVSSKKLPNNPSFQKPVKQPLKSPKNIKKPFEKAVKKPLKAPKPSTTSGKVKKAPADKWSRTPKSIQDRAALDAAKKGAGERLPIKLNDPKYKGMEKWEHKIKSKNGNDSVVHYVRNPKTGKLMDFKFTKHSTD